MNASLFTVVVPNEAEMMAFGGKLAAACDEAGVIFLYGDLGAGKTTLSRGFLRGLGFEGKVKSPTYTLVEPYEIQGRQVFHFDFYRLHDPEELEFIGIQDYFVPKAICLVEWPERGGRLLPLADLSCYIDLCASGRQIRLEAHTARGKTLFNQIVSLAGDDGE